MKKTTKKRTLIGIVGGVVVVCCGLSTCVAVLSPKPAATPTMVPTIVVQLAAVATDAPTQDVPTDAPTAEPTLAATATTVPTETTAPAIEIPIEVAPESTATDAPAVAAATEAPATAEVATSAPVVVGASQPQSANPTGVDSDGVDIVDPPWLPCAQGQIKGSQTNKYHVPDGKYYARTFRNVTCFNSEAEAQAANFVRAKNQ